MSIESNERRSRWAIVGGGFLGMTLALRLAQQGKAVAILEAADSLGGLASTWSLGDIVWDRHYHVILPSDFHLRALLRELGMETQLNWGTTRTGFYLDGRLHSLSNVFEFLRFPALNVFDKIRLALTILYASRIENGRALEHVLVADWLQRLSGRRVWEKLWLPLLRAKLGDSYRQTSAAFIWSTIARLYGARRSQAKREVFGYVSGGYARIIDNFALLLERKGVKCQLQAAVRTVDANATGLCVALSNGQSQLFDNVVFTTAAPIIVRACPQLTAHEKARLNAIQYQGILCASLLMDNPLSDFYITNVADDWVPFTAIIGMSALVDRRNFGGRFLTYLPKYLACEAEEFRLSDDQLREAFLSALGRIFPRFQRTSVSCFKVSRVKYLVPIPTLCYSSKLPPVNTSVPGLHIVNSTQIVNGTLNVNETVALAERAAMAFAALPSRVRDTHALQKTDENYRQPVA